MPLVGVTENDLEDSIEVISFDFGYFFINFKSSLIAVFVKHSEHKIVQNSSEFVFTVSKDTFSGQPIL